MTDMSTINTADAEPASTPVLEPVAAATPPSPPPPAGSAKKSKKGGVSPVQVLLVAAGVATLAWGAWMTRSVMDLQTGGEPQFVKVQLQGLVGESIRAQARTATPPEKVSTETGAFMAELDKAVKGLSSDGKIVLINEAIVAGDVPDVTDAVRKQVYAKIPQPRQAAAQDVDAAMRNYLLGAGAPGAAPAVASNMAPTPASNGAPNGLGN